MTKELELLGFKSPGAAITSAEWLEEQGSIALKHRHQVHILVAINEGYVWTLMSEDDLNECVPEGQRGDFLQTTVCASYREWCKLHPTQKVYDLIYFYDRRVFVDNKPSHIFRDIPTALQFVGKML